MTVHRNLAIRRHISASEVIHLSPNHSYPSRGPRGFELLGSEIGLVEEEKRRWFVSFEVSRGNNGEERAFVERALIF